MNHSLLSSKYVKSILNEELPLVVLVLLERKGLATENEIINSVRVVNHRLKGILLDLKLNQFIDYGNLHIKLTEKGKLLIDRLDLQREIMEDILDSLYLSEPERDDYSYILNEYRKNSFRLYQNSICSIRVWRNMADSVPNSNSTEQLIEITAGMRSLLIRDIRNWLRHEPSNLSVLNRIKSNLKNLLWNRDLQTLQSSYSDKFSKTLVSYLIMFEQTDEKFEIQSNNHLVVEPLLYTLHSLQAISEPDQWFDDWYNTAICFPNHKKYKKANNYVQRVTETFYKNKIGLDVHKKNTNNIYIYSWSPTKYKSDINETDNLLRDIMLSSSFDELQQRTGIDSENLALMIDELMIKCSSLKKGYGSSN